jgi:hypothetical protein
MGQHNKFVESLSGPIFQFRSAIFVTSYRFNPKINCLLVTQLHNSVTMPTAEVNKITTFREESSGGTVSPLGMKTFFKHSEICDII